jgi:hypothetical protein
MTAKASVDSHSQAVAGDGETGPPAHGTALLSVARIIGALLLVMAVAAGSAELGVRSALLVPGDAEQTAARILAAPWLFRAAFVGYLVAFLLDVPVGLLFYALLKPTARTLAAFSACLRLVYAALAVANLHNYVFQRLDAYEHGFKLALVCFGAHLLLLGVLLIRSDLVPKAIGRLVVLAGGAYLADTLTLFASRSVHAAIAPYLAVAESFEILLAGWLLVRGVTHGESGARTISAGSGAAVHRSTLEERGV